MENTAAVDLVSRQTDLEAVKEHLHSKLSESEIESLGTLLETVFSRDSLSESEAEEVVESTADTVRPEFMPFGDNPDSLVEVLLEARNTIEQLRGSPMHKEVANRIQTMVGYFYDIESFDVTHEEMVRVQERCIANDDELSLVIPL